MPGSSLHRGRIHSDEETTSRDGIPVTSVARTLFDLAESSISPTLKRSFEEADRLHLLRLRELEKVIAGGGGATLSSRSGKSSPS